MLAAQRTVFVATDVADSNPCIPVWVRRGHGASPTSAMGRQLEGWNSLGDLGVTIPGLDTMATAAKAIFYVGVGTALIVTSMFAWRVIDTFFGE